MRLILRYLLRYKKLLLFNFISAFGFALAELGIPTLIGNMVDNGVERADPVYLWKMFGVIIFISVLGTIGTILLAYFSNRISTNIVYDIRKDIFDKAMGFSRENMESIGVSSMITRTGQDAYQIMIFVNTLLRSALISPIMLVVSIVLIIMTSWRLSFIILGTIPLIILGVVVIFRYAGKISENQQKSIDRINLILRQNISGIRVIRAFGRQKEEEAKFEKENKYYQSQTLKLFKLMQLSDPLFFFLMNIATVLIYYFASLMIGHHQLLLGQLMMFTEYLFHCMMSVLVFCMVFMMYPRAVVSANRIQEVLDTNSSIREGEKILHPEDIDSLRFDNVTFTYPDGKHSTLQNVSFEAKKGQKVAVVGSTGSGKSSLVQLIERFYEPETGSISINGTDLREFTLESLRSSIGYISQKPHIFNGSIADNITFGKEDASADEIAAAAALAQASDFIADKDEGYETIISEDGTNLSGGQKQRLSIARSLITRPGLYIFDDSFSALDFATDARLRRSIAPLIQDSIMLVVAQRISTIMDTDLILVLDEGKLSAAGTHKDLLDSSPVYRQIVLSQMSLEEAMR